MRYSLLVLMAALGLLACRRSGDLLPNQAPSASLNLKDITLSDETHLVSTVQLFWTGSDVDGLVKGYRVSVNNQPYYDVGLRTDSLFRFSLDPGNTTQSISFRVVAVDDHDNVSEPAELTLPIRNTPPVASFNARTVPRADTVMAVITLPVSAIDPDGNETLDSMFLRVNGGPWLPLPANTGSVTITPQDPRATSGTQPARVYLNASLTLSPGSLQGLTINGLNLFELKARDKASAESPIAQIILGTDGTPKQYFFKPITSDLLVLDAHSGIANPTPESFYFPALAAAYPQGFDYIDLVGNNGVNQQKLFAPTMTILLSNYKKVFWYSDDVKSTNKVDSLTLMAETAAPVLTQFYTQAGKHLLFSTRFPDGTNRVTNSSPLFQVLPIDSILYASQRARLNRNRDVTSTDANYPILHTLTGAQNGTPIDGLDTFYAGATVDTLYVAPITFTSDAPPTYSRAVGGRYPHASAHPSLIFFTMDLDRLAGTPDNFNLFLNDVLNRDFND